MIVGANARMGDLNINVTKNKKLTNVRASGSDDNINLTPPKKLTLEEALEYIADDELVEVTPQSIRLRKRTLRPQHEEAGGEGGGDELRNELQFNEENRAL